MFCPLCGSHIEMEASNFCPYCGQPLDTVWQQKTVAQSTASRETSFDTFAVAADGADSVAVASSMRQSSIRVLTCLLFSAIGLTMVALVAQMGIMLMGVLPVKYIGSMRMAGWGISGVGIILSLVVFVLHRDKRRRQTSSFFTVNSVHAARSSFLMIIAAIIAGVLIIILCIVNSFWITPKAIQDQSHAFADCRAEYRRFSKARKNALPDNGLDNISAFDFRKDSTAYDGIKNQTFSCDGDASARELRSVRSEERSWVDGLPAAIDAVSKSLKSRDDYTMDDIVRAAVDGSYRSISGMYCRLDGVCWFMHTYGSIVGQVGVNDPLQSGNVTDSLTIGGDKNQDFLYRHGIGLTLTGPEDEATCMQGSGSDCDDVPRSDMLSYQAVVWYFPKGVDSDALRRYLCLDGQCSVGFVQPDTSRPFLLVPYTHGAVGSANEPSDWNVYYLQDEIINDKLG